MSIGMDIRELIFAQFVCDSIEFLYPFKKIARIQAAA
jgi:hypothetical protein